MYIYQTFLILILIFLFLSTQCMHTTLTPSLLPMNGSFTENITSKVAGPLEPRYNEVADSPPPPDVPPLP